VPIGYTDPILRRQRTFPTSPTWLTGRGQAAGKSGGEVPRSVVEAGRKRGTVSNEDARARALELYPFYVGMFTLSEPKRDVEKRVEKAIDASMAPLSMAIRMIGKPIMKAVALIPDSIEFAREGERALVTFSRKLVLDAELGGPPHHQKVITGAWADVSHAARDGAIETRISSESGTVINRYELDGDALIGHVHMESPHLPSPIVYIARLTRRR